MLKILFKSKNNLLLLLFLLLSITSCMNTPPVQTESGKKAMTWTNLKLIKTWNGEAHYALVGSDVNTNPYQGDTPITATLPILCIKKANLPKPSIKLGTHTTPGGAYRATWSGGYIGLSNPVKGTALTSLTIANNICAEEFGSGFQMAEFHDGDADVWAGWDFWGELVTPKTSLKDRFWVYINDQQSNPW